MLYFVMSVNVLLFDLDGTLVDTIRDITNALNYALKPVEIQELSVHDTKALVGEGITRLLEKVISVEKRGFLEEVKSNFLSYYERHLTDHAVVYPGVADTLRHFGRCRKAVISNKRAHLSRGILHKLELLGFFDLIIGSDTTPEKKPSPIPITYALEQFGASPEEAVMVGDSDLDIAAGRKAGVTTIAATYGYREKHALADADFIINHFPEIIDVLDSFSSKFL